MTPTLKKLPEELGREKAKYIIDKYLTEKYISLAFVGEVKISEDVSNDLTKIKNIAPSPLTEELGTYNIIFVKLKKDLNLHKTITKINTLLKEKKIPLQAISWNEAIGMFGQIAMLMKGALFLFVLFLQMI